MGKMVLGGEDCLGHGRFMLLMELVPYALGVFFLCSSIVSAWGDYLY